MSRKKQIEDIVVATLINNKEKYWPSARCCLTPDMFSGINQNLYRDMMKGEPMDLLSLNDRYPEHIGEIVAISIDDDFDYKIWEYNFNQRMFSQNPKYSLVTFDDYITKLIQLYEQSDRCAGTTAR